MKVSIEICRQIEVRTGQCVPQFNETFIELRYALASAYLNLQLYEIMHLNKTLNFIGCSWLQFINNNVNAVSLARAHR